MQALNVANQALAGIPGACGMCGDALPPGSIRLNCNHHFHTVCIHGRVLYDCAVSICQAFKASLTCCVCVTMTAWSVQQGACNLQSHVVTAT